MLAALGFLLFAAPPPRQPAHVTPKAIYDAAASGDRGRFEAVVGDARATIDSMPLGAARNALRRSLITAIDLDRVWRFDGVYWSEQSLPDYYDRLAGEYADFERFITPYRVIDNNGRAFYPKQETREFLVDKLRPANSGKRST